jgi:hypothetical protein
MTEPRFDDEPDDFYDDDGWCEHCGGEGWILTLRAVGIQSREV